MLRSIAKAMRLEAWAAPVVVAALSFETALRTSSG
jgi:hypothetical protein